MKQKNKPIALCKKLFGTLCAILLLCVFCYGALLLGLGLWEQRTLHMAKEQYAAVPVMITEISAIEDEPRCAITLEPIDAKAKDRLGITCTTVIRPQQSEGDILTMYYDPNAPQTRIVDFRTAQSLLMRGALCSGVSLFMGVLWLIYRRSRKKRRPPAVTMVQNTPNI